MHESADFMYIVPPYRFSVYAMGILLGFTLHKFQNTSLTQKQLNLGWLSAIACMIATVAICIGNVTYTPFHDAMFAGIGSITFCAFFAWIIFAAHLGHKSVYMSDIAINYASLFLSFQMLLSGRSSGNIWKSAQTWRTAFTWCSSWCITTMSGQPEVRSFTPQTKW